MIRVIVGDCRQTLQDLPAGSVDCCVTSPPYWSLRDYGSAQQIGQEASLTAYIRELVQVFRQVRRVLVARGTVWLNLGDRYDGKQLAGIPWRVALSLQADGWILRQDVIWSKPNPMPESVTDRCTKAHEYIFLLSVQEDYYYDAAAMQEPARSTQVKRQRTHKYAEADATTDHRLARNLLRLSGRKWTTRNRRTVWQVAVSNTSGNHYAPFPVALIDPCIRAGVPAGGTVIDPFAGSGTVGVAAAAAGRSALLLECNPEYAVASCRRIAAEGYPVNIEGIT